MPKSFISCYFLHLPFQGYQNAPILWLFHFTWHEMLECGAGLYYTLEVLSVLQAKHPTAAERSGTLKHKPSGRSFELTP